MQYVIILNSTFYKFIRNRDFNSKQVQKQLQAHCGVFGFRKKKKKHSCENE